ncbi:MAG TPA: DAK2 domain-containing protein [Streptosporangiaceae bacterium]|nr:DAK2 domain-containing protein [Streptosporangiaceae bacterium]
MSAEVLDGDTVRRWCRLSADALSQTRAAIDALNVFPVPDADTGTNLHITLISAADAAESIPPDAASAEVWHAAARGALLGACGNSGIIVSQLLRGLADVCAAESPCDGAVVARALTHAAASARNAVNRPAEGTVLTVADAAALAGTAAAGDVIGSAKGRSGLAAVVTAAAAAAREALARTSEQLDVLAARGVVDAGAAGLCVLLDALVAVITEVRPEVFEVPAAPSWPAGARSAPNAAAAVPGVCSSAGYEVTYLLEAPAEPVRLLRERLDLLGDSVVVVGGEDLWSVHVHVADAGAAIEEGLRAGRPRRITVTWLGAHDGASARGGDPAGAGFGVVAVADSDGLMALLRAAGARVLRQRDTAGPAVPALIEAIRQAGTHVVVIPNAGRTAGLARAAAARLADEGIEVSVIAARSPLQAIAALAVHDQGRGFAADVTAMGRAAAGMRWGSVVGPNADGGYSGLDGDQARVTGAAQGEVATTLADMLLSRGGELVTLMEGAGADPGLAGLVMAEISRVCPGAEIVCYDRGRVPLLIGVE